MPLRLARPARAAFGKKEHPLQVLVRDNNVDQALKALKKKMQREGIFREMKLRGHYEKPSEKKARQKAEAVRRARKLARKKLQREGLLPMKPKVIPGAGGPGGRDGGRGPRPGGGFGGGGGGGFGARLACVSREGLATAGAARRFCSFICKRFQTRPGASPAVFDLAQLPRALARTRGRSCSVNTRRFAATRFRLSSPAMNPVPASATALVRLAMLARLRSRLPAVPRSSKAAGSRPKRPMPPRPPISPRSPR